MTDHDQTEAASQAAWIIDNHGVRHTGKWIVGGFETSAGAVIPLDDITDSSAGPPRY